MIQPLTIVPRPSRLIKNKDEQYHRMMARWGISASFNASVQYNQFKSIINQQFYRNNQWLLDDDLENFMMDTTGESRQRLQPIDNIIYPIVKRFEGMFSMMDISYKATNASPFVVKKNETEMMKRLTWTNISNQYPAIKDRVKAKQNIGDTQQETAEIFENEFIDKDIIATNVIIQHNTYVNPFDLYKKILATNKALDGIAILNRYIAGAEVYWEPVQLPYFIWDNGAQMPDLRDSEYMGRINPLGAGVASERWVNLDERDLTAIDNICSNNSWKSLPMTNYILGQYANIANRCPIYEMKWRDVDYAKFGYVRHRSGMIILAQIDNMDVPEDQRYGEEDLVKPETPGQIRTLYGKETAKVPESRNRWARKMYMDVIRYCDIVPQEVMAYSNTNYNSRLDVHADSKYGAGDLILDYGVVPYQTPFNGAPNTAQYPFFCDCYDYRYGELIAPVDYIISPQRMINRALALVEAQMNNSIGSNYAFDARALDGDLTEDEMEIRMKNSKPIKLDGTRMGGIQNAMIPYGGKAAAAANELFGIKESLKNSVQFMTGMNDAMVGSVDNPKTLVGVTQNNVQMGTIMQEGFYSGLEDLFQRVYTDMSDTCRRLYADNNIKLVNVVGEEFAKIVDFTSDIKNVDIRIKVTAAVPEQKRRELNNEMLMKLLEMKVIDETAFGNLFNRVDIEEELAYYIRQYLIQKNKIMQQLQEQQAEKSQKDNEKQQAMMAAAQQNQLHQEQREDTALAGKYKHDDDKTDRRGVWKIISDKAKENPNSVPTPAPPAPASPSAPQPSQGGQ